MSTLAMLYPAGTEIRCPHCLEWAEAEEFELVGEDGVLCPECDTIDRDSIPERRMTGAAKP